MECRHIHDQFRMLMSDMLGPAAHRSFNKAVLFPLEVAG